MGGLKEVRLRIASVKSTEQITNAMKMVAASKLRRAQNAILRLRPYAAKLREIMENLSLSAGDSDESIYTTPRPVHQVLLVVMTSNRGLCGAFNTNIIKAALEQIHHTYETEYRHQGLSLITIGRKGTDYFRKRNYPVIASWDELYDDLRFEEVKPRAHFLMEAFAARRFDRIDLIYNQFKNAAVQRLVIEPYLPLVPPASGADPQRGVVPDYLFEPDKEEILHELIPKSLRIQLFKALLDSYASEMGARMTAMQQATENARELLKQLRISYNKARQNQITNELMEIVSGAEALKG